MKALRIHGIKDVRVDTVDDPTLEDARDAIIRVTSTAIRGSDLHIFNGAAPQPHPLTLGHEFMGIVEEVGKGVGNLKRGDRVVVPFPIACGHCLFCNHELPGHCENSNPELYGPEGNLLIQKGGGLFGFTDLYGAYNGGQAEFVRVPYADFGPRKVPDNLTDEQVLFLSDIFPTGYSGIDWAGVKGGEIVAIFGAGPVGIMAAKSAWLRGAGRVIIVDTQQYRLDQASIRPRGRQQDAGNGCRRKRLAAPGRRERVGNAANLLNLTAATPYRSVTMKLRFLALAAAVLLAGCNQAAPDTSTPAGAAPAAGAPEAPAPAPDTAATAAPGAPVAATPTATIPTNATLKLAFDFKPAPNADDPAHPRTSARLLLQGTKPFDIDLGKFATKPDQVDAAKAKLAGFPSGMLMGFRSYDPATGTSYDLAVLNVDARHLRIVQRRVEESAAEPGKFETSREIPIPASTTVTVAPMPAAKADKK